MTDIELDRIVTLKRHSLRRTSPKGQDFIGTCVNCGTPNLTFKAMREECPNQRGVTQEESLLEAITGKVRNEH